MTTHWLKAKYSQSKTRGKYKSSSNDQGSKSKTKRKAGDKERAEIQARQPNVTLVLLPNGKRRFVRERRS